MWCRSQPRGKAISKAVLEGYQKPRIPQIDPCHFLQQCIHFFFLFLDSCVFFSHTSSALCYTQQSLPIWFSFPARFKMVGDFKKGASFEPAANVVRMESVTQSIACWWLRAVSAVSSPWFMDTKWTLVSKNQLRVHSSNWALFWLWLACIFFPFMPKYFARQLAPSSFGSAVPQG